MLEIRGAHLLEKPKYMYNKIPKIPDIPNILEYGTDGTGTTKVRYRYDLD